MYTVITTNPLRGTVIFKKKLRMRFESTTTSYNKYKNTKCILFNDALNDKLNLLQNCSWQKSSF